MSFGDFGINALFKKGRDGRRLYFPWRTLGHGYIIPSDKEYQRLRRAENVWRKLVFGIMLASGPVIISLTKHMTGSVGIGIVLLLFFGIPVCVCQHLWIHAQCRRLRKTDEKY